MRNMSFPITNASRKCLLCDKPYLASSRTQKYCGDVCAKKSLKQKSKKLDLPNPPYVKQIQKICLGCKKFLLVENFSRVNIVGYAPRCKPCTKIYNNEKQKEKLAKRMRFLLPDTLVE